MIRPLSFAVFLLSALPRVGFAAEFDCSRSIKIANQASIAQDLQAWIKTISPLIHALDISRSKDVVILDTNINDVRVKIDFAKRLTGANEALIVVLDGNGRLFEVLLPEIPLGIQVDPIIELTKNLTTIDAQFADWFTGLRSKFSHQDKLKALDWLIDRFNVDASRMNFSDEQIGIGQRIAFIRKHVLGFSTMDKMAIDLNQVADEDIIVSRAAYRWEQSGAIQNTKFKSLFWYFVSKL